MKNTRFTSRSLFTAILSLSLLAGCSKSPSVTPFKDQAKWDFAKQQRWTAMQEFMKTRASELIDAEQHVHEDRAVLGHFDTAQLQDFYDSIERKRTGNSQAKSCRHMINTKRCDYSACSQDQLTAEFFQLDEQIHGHQ